MKKTLVSDHLHLLSEKLYDGEVVFNIKNSFYGIGEEGNRAIIAIHNKSFFQDKYIFTLSPIYLLKEDLDHITLICKSDNVAFKIPIDILAKLNLQKQSHKRPLLRLENLGDNWTVETKDGLFNIDKFKYDLSSGNRDWVKFHSNNIFTLKTILQSHNKYPVNN